MGEGGGGKTPSTLHLSNFRTDAPRIGLQLKILFAIKALPTPVKNWKNLLGGGIHRRVKVSEKISPMPGQRKLKMDNFLQKLKKVVNIVLCGMEPAISQSDYIKTCPYHLPYDNP